MTNDPVSGYTDGWSVAESARTIAEEAERGDVQALVEDTTGHDLHSSGEQMQFDGQPPGHLVPRDRLNDVFSKLSPETFTNMAYRAEPQVLDEDNPPPLGNFLTQEQGAGWMTDLAARGLHGKYIARIGELGSDELLQGAATAVASASKKYEDKTSFVAEIIRQSKASNDQHQGLSRPDAQAIATVMVSFAPEQRATWIAAQIKRGADGQGAADLAELFVSMERAGSPLASYKEVLSGVITHAAPEQKQRFFNEFALSDVKSEDLDGLSAHQQRALISGLAMATDIGSIGRGGACLAQIAQGQNGKHFNMVATIVRTEGSPANKLEFVLDSGNSTSHKITASIFDHADELRGTPTQKFVVPELNVLHGIKNTLEGDLAQQAGLSLKAYGDRIRDARNAVVAVEMPAFEPPAGEDEYESNY